MYFVSRRFPIEFVLFYPYRIQVKPLKKALKKVASLFWPFFGEYTNGEIKALTDLEDDWWKEETIEKNFDPTKKNDNLHNEFGTEYLKLLQYSKNFIPPRRLCQFKLIHFQNGTMLIPTMNHLVGDGYSYFYFLSVLAALYRKRKLPFASLLIGNIFKPRLTRTKNKNFQVPKDNIEGYCPDEKLTVEFIDFKKTEIQQKALQASEKSGLRISTNDILSAIEVLSIFDSQSNENPSNFHLIIPIDVRRGVPEYGKKFFGNGIMLLKILFQSTEMANSTIESIAIRIRKSFPNVNQESFELFNEKLIQWISTGNYDNLLPYNPKTDCLVTNLSRIPFKALNFGDGRPTLVAPTTIGRGSTLVLSNQDSYILRRVR
jgi:NRPS condensation-like uncharacterized protein